MSKFCLLFDMDGTLVETDHLHFEAFNELLGEHDRRISEEEFETAIHGNRNAFVMPYLFPQESTPRHEDLALRKEAMFRARIQSLDPRLGLGDLLDWADRHGCPFAIVTNAPRDNARLMLSALGVAERFDHLIIGDELPRGKPDPMPYLTGLDRLGGKAGHAIAFEDSIAGITSAVAAGIHTVGLRTNLPDEQLLAAGASRVVGDFHDPGLLAWLDERLKAEAA